MTTREKLAELADNLWWSWNPEATDLFRHLNPSAFQATRNSPRSALAFADDAVLENAEFEATVNAVYDRFTDYMRPASGARDIPRVAYICMEFGLHESLPFYSGGLGILAGDHVKAASDFGVPLTAVGLLLRDGYFRQYFDRKAWQRAEYPGLDITRAPISPVLDENANPITVAVPLGSTLLHLRAWRLNVGRCALYLLDADFDANGFEQRFLTRRLYSGNSHTRISQEIILGIGGIRMLRRLGVETDIVHLNEGHCAFAALELLREQLALGHDRTTAEHAVRDRVVFTTHTPVKAGHDRFDADLLLSRLDAFRSEVGLSPEDLLGYGRANPYDVTEPFTMTILGLKLAGRSNGVSKLNGQIARAQWHHLHPHVSVDTVPITHVTNGVHLGTWTAEPARRFFEERLGALASTTEYWSRIREIPAADLWELRCGLRADLIRFVEDRLRRQSLPQQVDLSPHALTLGFARRFATYKRAPLFFHDLDRAARIIRNTDRPVQLIFAGKAHPSDDAGKEFIQMIFQFTQDPIFAGRVVLLENYDMEIGRMLVSGADVWLNNPRRPYEASGTSGQKVAAHGGLNLSILDGWWPEGFDGTNGWAIGHDSSASYMEPNVQDQQDSQFLYAALEEDVIPEFYRRDTAGIPQDWVARMKNAMGVLPAQFSARRMVADYVAQIYSAAEVLT